MTEEIAPSFVILALRVPALAQQRQNPGTNNKSN
jgi:hypothetical protein